MRRIILAAGFALAALGAWRSADATALANHGTQAPVRAAASQQALPVTISGVNQVFPGYSCTWSANVSGGTPPYTYHWVMAGMIEDSNTGDTWTGYAAHTGQVGLDVLVTDAYGQQGWGTLVIWSDMNNSPCW